MIYYCNNVSKEQMKIKIYWPVHSFLHFCFLCLSTGEEKDAVYGASQNWQILPPLSAFFQISQRSFPSREHLVFLCGETPCWHLGHPWWLSPDTRCIFLPISVCISLVLVFLSCCSESWSAFWCKTIVWVLGIMSLSRPPDISPQIFVSQAVALSPAICLLLRL